MRCKIRGYDLGSTVDPMLRHSAPGRLEPIGIASAERDLGALAEQLLDGREPDAGAATGDHGDLIGQSQIHDFRSLP